MLNTTAGHRMFNTTARPEMTSAGHRFNVHMPFAVERDMPAVPPTAISRGPNSLSGAERRLHGRSQSRGESGFPRGHYLPRAFSVGGSRRGVLEEPLPRRSSFGPQLVGPSEGVINEWPGNTKFITHASRPLYVAARLLTVLGLTYDAIEEEGACRAGRW